MLRLRLASGWSNNFLHSEMSVEFYHLRNQESNGSIV